MDKLTLFAAIVGFLLLAIILFLLTRRPPAVQRTGPTVGPRPETGLPNRQQRRHVRKHLGGFRRAKLHPRPGPTVPLAEFFRYVQPRYGRRSERYLKKFTMRPGSPSLPKGVA